MSPSFLHTLYQIPLFAYTRAARRIRRGFTTSLHKSHNARLIQSRVERDAPCYRVRPLGLRLPSKRTSPFFGGYPSSNRTCRFPAYGSPCGTGFIGFAPLRPSAPFHIDSDGCSSIFVCLARLAHIGHAPACAPFRSPLARSPPKGLRLSAVHLCTPHRPNCMLTSLQCRLLSFC